MDQGCEETNFREAGEGRIGGLGGPEIQQRSGSSRHQ